MTPIIPRIMMMIIIYYYDDDGDEMIDTHNHMISFQTDAFLTQHMADFIYIYIFKYFLAMLKNGWVLCSFSLLDVSRQFFFLYFSYPLVICYIAIENGHL